ncbi:MAG: lipase [Chthoniobacterales bacterium]
MTIKKRAVFFIGGYEPKTPAEFFTRLRREIGRFEQIWRAQAAISELVLSEDGTIASVNIETEAAGKWSVQTAFHFLVLDGIVQKDAALPWPQRLLNYLRAFADFVSGGVLFRMLRQSWRFSLYFLYPFGVMVVFGAIALLSGRLVAGLSVPLAGPIGMAAALAVLVVLTVTLGTRSWLSHLMNLWSFSRDYLRHERPDLETLLELWATAIVAQAQGAECDELLLVGHSTGGALILDIAARCLRLNPGFAGRVRETSLLTVGSTALKFGWHPAAADFRAKVQRLVDEPRLHWTEFQCLTDLVNFYRTDPVLEMGLQPRPVAAGEPPFPIVHQVHMRRMLDDAGYRHIRCSVFRMHYQFISGNSKRYFYDFFMICCGPLPLSLRAAERITGAHVPTAASP